MFQKSPIFKTNVDSPEKQPTTLASYLCLYTLKISRNVFASMNNM